jgi:hypothetical protein
MGAISARGAPGSAAMKRMLTIAAVLVLVPTTPAWAEELHSSNRDVDYHDTGEASANHLTVSVDGDDVEFVDSALIAPSGDCTSDGIFSARCPADILDIAFYLAAEDDELDAAGIGVPMYAFAGAGNDTIVTGAGDDGLAGGLGDDVLHGGPGADMLGDATAAEPGGGADAFHGDAGDDWFVGAGPDGMGAGSDVYDGGPGSDTIDYTAHATYSFVNLAGGYGHLGGADADSLVSIERVLAGPGPDILVGDGADNLLAGSGGVDGLYGGAGADRLEGQLGGDVLDGGLGPDVLRGGAESDLATYAEASGPVSVTLDNQPDDGQDGEHDDVGTDIERVRTTPFSDHVTGSSAANVVQAGAGDDTAEGGEGDDDLRGEAGADHLIGGPGRDTIAAGPGADHVEAGSGDDAIDVADGETDKVTCGIGIDAVTADREDVVFDDCEQVVMPPAGDVAEAPAPPAETPATVTPPAVAVVTLDGARVRVSRKGRARLPMRCDGSACGGTLMLTRRARALARAPYALAPGEAASVPFRLTRKGRALLRRKRRITVTATAGGVTRRYVLVRRRAPAR